jgi:hypothetical protein
MEKLNNIQRKDMSPNDLRDYPVWVWDDEFDSYCPLSGNEVFPEEYGTYLISARFRTVDKLEFNGYLIGDGRSFYAFGMFVKGEELVFNLNLPDLMEKNLQTVRRLVDQSSFQLFPLSYESPVLFEGLHTISGVITGS